MVKLVKSEGKSTKQKEKLKKLRKFYKEISLIKEGIGEKILPFKEWLTSGEYREDLKFLQPINLERDIIATATTPSEVEEVIYDHIIPFKTESLPENTWDMVKSNLKSKSYVHGLMFLIGGESGTGKTLFAGSACESKQITLSSGRVIPSGGPVYGIDFERKMRSVWGQMWPKKIGEDLIPFNCYVEERETDLIDPIGTLYQANRFIFAARHFKKGTLVIDTFSFYCNLILYSYMRLEKDISFSEFMAPDRKISIYEYQFKAKVVNETLRMLRNFSINIILIYQFKDKYDPDPNDPTNQYKAIKSGRAPDYQKNSDYWAEIVGEFSFVQNGEFKDRLFTVKKSNYEKRRISLEKSKYDAPSFSEVLSGILGEFISNK